MHHIFGAVCKFLRIGPSRIRNRELSVNENGQTRVQFELIDVVNGVCEPLVGLIHESPLAASSSTTVNEQLPLSTHLSNAQLLADLRDIVESDKFTIIDLSIHKTVRAVKGSLNYGVRGEAVSFKVEKVLTATASNVYTVEFRPSMVGRYRIDVENSEKKCQCSPYFLDVFNPKEFVLVRRPEICVTGTENLIEGNY